MLGKELAGEKYVFLKAQLKEHILKFWHKKRYLTPAATTTTERQSLTCSFHFLEGKNKLNLREACERSAFPPGDSSHTGL